MVDFFELALSVDVTKAKRRQASREVMVNSRLIAIVVRNCQDQMSLFDGIIDKKSFGTLCYSLG